MVAPLPLIVHRLRRGHAGSALLGGAASRRRWSGAVFSAGRTPSGLLRRPGRSRAAHRRGPGPRPRPACAAAAGPSGFLADRAGRARSCFAGPQALAREVAGSPSTRSESPAFLAEHQADGPAAGARRRVRWRRRLSACSKAMEVVYPGAVRDHGRACSCWPTRRCSGTTWPAATRAGSRGASSRGCAGRSGLAVAVRGRRPRRSSLPPLRPVAYNVLLVAGVLLRPPGAGRGRLLRATGWRRRRCFRAAVAGAGAR